MIIIGVVVGLVFPAADVSSGPFPPAVAATLTGVAISLAVFAVYTNHLTIAWVSAWALLTMSGKTETEESLSWVLIGFLFSSMLAAAVHAGLLKNRLRGAIVFGSFLAVISVAAAGIASLLHQADDFFMNTVESFVSDQSNKSTTGLGNSLTLTEKNTISPSMQPLLELSQLPGRLRSKVMDEFDGRQWTTSIEMKASLPTPLADRASLQSAKEIEMLFLADMDNSIPSPAGTMTVVNAVPRIEGGWILRGKPNRISLTLFTDPAELLPELVSGDPDDKLNDEPDQLDVPDELRPQIAPLAIEVIGGAESNVEKAKAIESFFQQNFEYSLSTDLSGDAHPLVTLIEQRRPAYCSYFASAMAVMLRSQSVPTRIVTGFVPGEVNPWTGRVIVRSRDAHAWVEVWSPEDNRFLAFDPTPTSSRRELMGHTESVNPIRAAVDAFRSAIHRIWLLLRHQPLTGITVLLASPLLWVTTGLLAFFWYRQRRRRVVGKPEAAPWQSDPHLDQLYERYLSSLRQAGITPGPAETDDELLARLAETGNQTLWEAASDFIDRYRATRFGSETIDERFNEFGSEMLIKD